MDILSKITLLVQAVIAVIDDTRQKVATRTNYLIKVTKPLGLEVNQDKTNIL